MSDASPYQTRYWTELFQLRVHVSYLEIYMGKSDRLDRLVNVFLAITSNSSICGWAIWSQYSFTWAVIIAISQLVNAAKQFLPYRMRLKAIGGALRELEELLVSSEMKWFDVAEGNLTEEEINKLQFEIRRTKIRALDKHFGEIFLPEKKKYFDEAMEIAETYVHNFYGE